MLSLGHLLSTAFRACAAQNLSPWPRSHWPGSLARPPCGASPWRQFQHPIVARVVDVEVAGTVHRHTLGAGQAVEPPVPRGKTKGKNLTPATLWVLEPAACFTTRMSS